MCYLGKYTKESRVISGVLLLDTTKSYSKARQLLDQIFGNTFLISNTYKKKLHEWPRIPPNDGPDLKSSNFIEACKTTISNIQYLNIQHYLEENHRMLQKLPRPAVERWNTFVDRELYNASELDGESDSGLLYSEFPSHKILYVVKEKRLPRHATQ